MYPSNEIVPSGEAGVSVRQDFSGAEIVRGAETATVAMAAQSKAMVEARFVVALRVPRKMENIRIAVSKLCKDPDFAAEALYVKPMGRTPNDWDKIDKRERLRRRLSDEIGNWPVGFSIRFIEAALFEFGNIDCDATVVWEDEEKRLTLITVMDLERNSSWHRTITTAKVVERSRLKDGEEPIAVRENAQGKMVYVLPANPQQVEQAEAAAVSKATRTLAEKMLPPHFKAEWRSILDKTILDKASSDPERARKALLDNYAEKGVLPTMIEQYLEHPLDQAQPLELVALRKLYVAISNLEITWRDVMVAKFGEEADRKPQASPAVSKVQNILSKITPATAASAASAQQVSPQASTGGTPQAGSGPSTDGQPGSLPTEPAKQAEKPVAGGTDEYPALQDLEDFPENLGDDEWLKVRGVIYRFNRDRGAYREWPEKQTQEEPQRAPVDAKRSEYSFGRKK